MEKMLEYSSMVLPALYPCLQFLYQYAVKITASYSKNAENSFILFIFTQVSVDWFCIKFGIAVWITCIMKWHIRNYWQPTVGLNTNVTRVAVCVGIMCFELTAFVPNTERHFPIWHCWLGIRKSVWPVKIEWWGGGVVICLERRADCLHMV